MKHKFYLPVVADKYAKIIAGIVCERLDWINEEISRGKVRDFLLYISPLSKYSPVPYATLSLTEYAAYTGNLRILKYFIEKRHMKFKGLTYNKQNLTHWALFGSKIKTLKYLINKGADINFNDDEGNTLLHYAVTMRNPELVEYLIKKGANVNEPNRDGMTPLHRAAQKADLQTVKVLIDAGADITAHVVLFFGSVKSM